MFHMPMSSPMMKTMLGFCSCAWPAVAMTMATPKAIKQCGYHSSSGSHYISFPVYFFACWHDFLRCLPSFRA